MNNDETRRIYEMLEDRSEDFQVAGLNNIDDKAWHKHLKKLGIRVVSKNELCKTYNDKTTDTITIMRGGRVVEQAPALELFDAPREPYTRQLLGAARRLELGAGQGA
jgi:hypothetical protein